MAVGWGSTLRLSKLQPLLTPEIDTKQMVGVDKNPWQKYVKKMMYSYFKGKEHSYNLHTNHCEAVFRQDPIVYGVGRCICRYIEGTLSIGFAIEHGNISCLGGGLKYFLFFF